MQRLLLTTIVFVSLLFASESSAAKPIDTLLGVWVVDYLAIQDAEWFREFQKEESFPAKGVPFWAMHIVEIRPDSIVVSQSAYGPSLRDHCEFEQIGFQSVRVVYKEEIRWRLPIFEVTIVDDDHLISHLQHDDWEVDLPLKRVFRASAVGLGAELPRKLLDTLEGTWVVDHERWGLLNPINSEFFAGIASSFEPRNTDTLELDEAGAIVAEWVDGERIPIRLRDFDGERWLLAAERITIEGNDGSILNDNADDALIVLTIEDEDHITLCTSAYRTPMIRIDSLEPSDPSP